VNHWIIAPIVLPLLAGALLALVEGRAPRLARWVSVLATLGFLAVAARLTGLAGSGEVSAYLLGNWQPPFGIVLALDRLSALMLLLTGLVALAALVHALGGWDRRGAHFHALFQFQLMGLAGAFLTADLFNLFVFFEVLLAASYGLLLHGAGRERLRASFHYVVLNLTASALFLIGVSLLYGLAGTLNLADLSVKLARLPAGDAGLAQVAGVLLLVVFGLKAAILPLHLWLPGTYAAAPAPVAALFAIMTKVGIYAIARVFTLAFGAGESAVAQVLLPAGLATLAAASLGALAAGSLRALSGWLVVASAGTLLAALGLAGAAGLGAALYYLIHSTLVAAALFLLAEAIGRQRGAAGDALEAGPAPARPVLLGALFFAAAAADGGLPPLAGFVGKLAILDAALGTSSWPWLFGVVLGSGVLVVVALSRAGSLLFWKSEGSVSGAAVPAGEWLPVAALLAAGFATVLFAGPVLGYARAAAGQLIERGGYVESVLGARPVAREAER
jgi:multicomponent K+:H+ antiporter subunit D